MTPRHKECLDFIGAFWAEKGYAPSYDEIKDALGAKSKSSVAALVTKLEERGYIQRHWSNPISDNRSLINRF